MQPDTNVFAKIGEDVTIYSRAQIIGRDRIIVGSHVIIDDFVFIGKHEKLIIGNHVHIASHASITGGGVCICCDFSGISSGSRVLTGTDRFQGGGLTGPTIPERYRCLERGRVVIGAHAIVGVNSVVLPNIEIGEGVTVGAGSVVTENLEPWGIYVGSPARRIATRRKEEILEFEQKLVQEENLGFRRFRTADSLSNAGS
jgi:acetyltransferase-like isoleucine patch superfamily enzyme